MKIAILSALMLILAGCASHSRSMFAKRGYSQEEIEEINKYSSEYISTLSRGRGFSNRLNSSQQVANEQRMRAIVCGCVKMLGDKCQKRPEGLSPEERTIWAKSNAAESSLKAVAQADNPFAGDAMAIDPQECI